MSTRQRQYRIAVLISGNGSNLQALIDAQARGDLGPTTIDLVVSNASKAYGLQRAADAGIPSLIQTMKPYKEAGKTRLDFDKDLAAEIQTHFRTSSGPDLIVLAGFMHILSQDFLSQFPKKVINLHPALPGAFDGIKAIERAFEAFQAGQITETGVMVHEVIPEVDRGRVILVEKVPIHKEDTVEDLASRIHSVEHGLLVRATRVFLTGQM